VKVDAEEARADMVFIPAHSGAAGENGLCDLRTRQEGLKDKEGAFSSRRLRENRKCIEKMLTCHYTRPQSIAPRA
jgi:hypothetical protein